LSFRPNAKSTIHRLPFESEKFLERKIKERISSCCICFFCKYLSQVAVKGELSDEMLVAVIPKPDLKIK
jgi:hypothetical protein